ncbi:3BP5L protein, partial [Asarcornis scutulata]|nr:3BP5L protein [Asarcornis scutulata]
PSPLHLLPTPSPFPHPPRQPPPAVPPAPASLSLPLPVPPQEHKAAVTALEARVARAKTRYAVALRNLEQISEQIHARRLQRLGLRRASPVGAEEEETGEAGEAAGGLLGAEGPPPDALSVLSLQTIASDLQKFDSVEHLLGLSDAASLNSGEAGGPAGGGRGGRGLSRHHRSVSL